MLTTLQLPLKPPRYAFDLKNIGVEELSQQYAIKYGKLEYKLLPKDYHKIAFTNNLANSTELTVFPTAIHLNSPLNGVIVVKINPGKNLSITML